MAHLFLDAGEGRGIHREAGWRGIHTASQLVRTSVFGDSVYGRNGLLCYPTHFTKNVKWMGHGKWYINKRSETYSVFGAGVYSPKWTVVLSHPFRKERGKDGAPDILLTLELKTL
jgi:hypothetical protein